MRTAAVLGFMCLVATACGHRSNIIIVNGIEVYESYWQKAISRIEPRATYELDCPAQQLEYVLLSKNGRAPNVVAVEGCGRRGVYERPTNQGYLGDWTRSGEITSVEASGSEPVEPSPGPSSP